MSNLGGIKCNVCGSQDYNILQFDHPDPKHAKEDRVRFRMKTDTQTRYYLKHNDEAKKKLRVLCRTCNVGRNRKYE